MTPEQLKIGIDLAKEISDKEKPITQMIKNSEINHDYINFILSGNIAYNIKFKLHPHQIETLKTVALAIAEKNLKTLKQEFSTL